MRRTARPAVTLLSFALAAALTTSPARGDAQVDRDNAPRAPERVTTPVGTSYLDLMHAGLLPDPLDGRSSPTATNFDPGTAPEGDFLHDMTYTRDGARLLLSNRGTNDVTVYDAATRAVLANVAVGISPAQIAVSNDYAIVPCAFSNEVWILNLSDYTVAAVIPTAEQPWVARVSPDGAFAYVACDIPDVCEKIDLTTLQHVGSITGFPIWLMQFGAASECTRTSVLFSGFEVTPDGQQLAVGNGVDSVFFFNTTTFVVDHTLAVPSPYALALSGDGAVAVAVCYTTPGSARRIDLGTHAVTGTVTLPASYSISTFGAGVNQDGSRAFLGVSSNSSAFVDFASSSSTILSSTFTPFWIGTSPDHTLALGVQFRFSVLSFASKSLVGQYEGNSQDHGAVSPVGARAAGFDPLRNEAVYFYSYSTPNSPQYLGQTPGGQDPEADAPRRVTITPDGHRAVVTNVLSGNACVLNLDTPAVEATLPIAPRPQDIAITSDGHWAVICAMELHRVDILDLTTNSIVAHVATNTRPATVSITPDNTRALVGNVQGNTLSVVRLNGAASFREADVPCGEIGSATAAFYINSAVQASPDNRYGLVAVSFDDLMRVFDRNANSFVAALPTGDFPLSVAFESTGQYATSANYSGNNYTVYRINGASSSVVGTFASGQLPLRVAYDPIHQRMAINNFNSKTVTFTNPTTGAVLSSTSYAAYGYPAQVLFDVAGDPMVLTLSNDNLVTSAGVVALPAAPAYFDYAASTRTAVVAMPGPDWVTVVRFDTADAPEVVTLPLSGGLISSLSPNPSSGMVRIGFRLASPGDVAIDLVDAGGRRVGGTTVGRIEGGSREVTIDASGLQAGIYFAVMRLDGRRIDSRKLTVR